MEIKWYQKNYRRNLIDMHINDWNDEFLSQFDIDQYFTYLRTARVTSAMIYLQSHVGLCYFPTKSGVMHHAFVGKEDQMRRLIDRCHTEGISVVGYYSLIFNTIEHDRHPDWRIVTDPKAGKSQRQIGKPWFGRYGHCCPNQEGYRSFLKAQIKEMGDYFTLDGIFYDMTYWEGVCYCDACQRRWTAETGEAELPRVQKFDDPKYQRFVEKRYEWIAEFCKWISDYTRKVMPSVTVSHNNAYSVAGDWHQGVWEGETDHCDYLAGDLYGDVYDHSFCIKYYYSATPNQPFEYMTSRFSEGLTQHTLTKTQTKLMQDTMLIVAHHGASLLIDSIDPRGTLDMRVAEKIGNSYERMMPYEKYLQCGEMLSDVAVWYSTTGRYNSEGQGFNSRTCSKGLVKNLIRSHVPVSVMANTKTHEMSQFKYVFAPAIAGITEQNRQDVYEYVKNGGCFYFSGVEDSELLVHFFGVDCKGFTPHVNTYVAPARGMEKLFFDFSDDYPLSMTYRHPLVEVKEKNVEIWARLEMPYSDADDNNHFASIHSNPPGILTDYPSVMKVNYGKGTVIWSALPIEEYEGYQYRAVMLNLLRKYFTEDQQSVISDAPARVELVTFSEKDRMLISTVDMGHEEDIREIAPFTVSVRCDRKPKQVCLLPLEQPIGFVYENGRVVFQTAELTLFDMYRLDF